MYWCWLTSDFLFIIWAGLWEDGRAREGVRVFQGQDWEHTAYYPGRIGESTLAVSGRSLDGIPTYKAELDITRLDELKDNLIEDQGVDPFAGSNCTDPTAVDMIRMKNNYLLPSSHSISFRRDAKSIQIFPDCIVISEIKKLDEIKKETTFTMKDRFNANIMMAVCRLMWGMQSPSIRWGRENLKIGGLFLW